MQNGKGNGNWYKAINYIHRLADGTEFGQNQETGRDQGHAMLNIALMGNICQLTWNQGDDFFGLDDHRFLKCANWMYACLRGGERGGELQVLVCDNKKLSYAGGGIAVPGGTPLKLAAAVDRNTLEFFFSTGKNDWKPFGEKLPAGRLSDDYIEKNGLVFTGAFVGICCHDLDNRTAFADFDSFSYLEQ